MFVYNFLIYIPESHAQMQKYLSQLYLGYSFSVVWSEIFTQRS